MHNICMYEKHPLTPLVDLNARPYATRPPTAVALARNSSMKFVFTILNMNGITCSLCLGWEHLLTGGGTVVLHFWSRA